MRFKDVVFYNHYGNGDLWASREIVKTLMNSTLLAENYYYAHAKDHHLFFDFPSLKFMALNEYCNMRQPYVLYGDTLYINTWIGYAYGKYVFPGVSVTLSNYMRMFNDTLQLVGSLVGEQPQLLSQKCALIPEPDYSYLDDVYIDRINKFIFDRISQDIILAANGDVFSNQSNNFDLSRAISSLALQYPDKIFIMTEEVSTYVPENLYFTSNIIGKESGSDLPEISYLSQYVDVIIGRSSGPFTFSQTQYNYNNPELKIVSFTHQRECAHMLSQEEAKAKLYWIPPTALSLESIDRLLEEIINE